MNLFNPVLIIQKKRDGQELSPEEIQEFVRGITDGRVTDYQSAAFLMAVYFQGMTPGETVALTHAMRDSGDRYDLSSIPGAKVDKHSTGGVGDKVSLILAPLAAACGLKVPMMSGRGLGHSGGTVDKLESISGFNMQLSQSEFKDVLSKLGCAMIRQSQTIAPADKKLYSLRDVTGTVECVPLIAASILSKKLAEGADALVLDVKVGNGAFMTSREEARKLAKALIQVAKKSGLKCRAVLTDMNQPLGYAVGNALEVVESIEVLRGEKCGALSKSGDLTSCDLKEITIQLCAHMLEAAKATKNIAEARKLAHAKLTDGTAWKIFQELVKLQGGSLDQILDPKKLPRAPHQIEWKAKKRGYITRIDTKAIGNLLVELGGGRKRAEDEIDPAVGFIFHKKLGAKIAPGDVIAVVHSRESANSAKMSEIEQVFHQSIQISPARKAVPKLIYEVIQ